MDAGMVVSGAALLIALAGLILNSRKETRQDAASMAEIKASLNSVNNGVTDIRVELRTMRESLNELAERLARVEVRSENNEKRIATLEKTEGG